MPTERFNNLSARKQGIIREAAIREFTRVPFDQVSINKIIKDAEISRGSFYTYFTDKWDLMDYLMTNTRNWIIHSIEEEMAKSDTDYWGMLRITMRIMLEICADEQKRKFLINICNSIGLSEMLIPNTGPDSHRLTYPINREEVIESFRKYSKGNYNLNNEEIFALSQLSVFGIGHGVMEYLSGTDSATVMERFETKLTILRNGTEFYREYRES